MTTPTPSDLSPASLLAAPWNHSDGGVILDITGEPLFRPSQSAAESEARGNLIAAAPDLLAACRLALVTLRDDPALRQQLAKTVRALETALRKAGAE